VAMSWRVFSGLSSIGVSLSIELGDSVIADDREYGSTEPFRTCRTRLLLRH
jgi:hypothetical protein